MTRKTAVKRVTKTARGARKRPLDVFRVFVDGLKLYSDNFTLLALIAVAGNIPVLLQQFLKGFKSVPSVMAQLVLVIAAVGTGVWSGVAMLIAMRSAYSGKKASFKLSFAEAVPRIWPYLVFAILLYLVLFNATILLVIPGLYYSVVFFAVIFAAVYEDTGRIDPFRFSSALVRGNFWRVALLDLMLMGVIALFVPLLTLANFADYSLPGRLAGRLLESMLQPLFYTIPVMTYFRLKELKKGSAELRDKKALAPRKNGCLIAIALTVVPVIVTFMFIVWVTSYLNSF